VTADPQLTADPTASRLLPIADPKTIDVEQPRCRQTEHSGVAWIVDRWPHTLHLITIVSRSFEKSTISVRWLPQFGQMGGRS
jgi:hypothetical protein